MIFGHEVGSIQAVVIGKSNLGLVPIWTRRTQNSGPKGECVLILLHSFAASVIRFFWHQGVSFWHVISCSKSM